MTDFNSTSLTTEGIENHAGFAGPQTTQAPAAPQSKFIRTIKNVGWIFFGVFCLVIFTILKLPEDRIKNYVQGTVASMLAPKGIVFTADKGYISIGWGISYVMKGVTLNFPPPRSPRSHRQGHDHPFSASGSCRIPRSKHLDLQR